MDPSAEYNRIIRDMTTLVDRATDIEIRALAARAAYEQLRNIYATNGTGGPALAIAITNLQNIIGEFNTLPRPAMLDFHRYYEDIILNPDRQAVYDVFIERYNDRSTRFYQIYDRLRDELGIATIDPDDDGELDTATIDSEFIDILTHPAGSYNLANIRFQKMYMRTISEYNDTQCQGQLNSPNEIIAQLDTITYADMRADSDVYKQVACSVKTILRENRHAVLRILNTPDIPVEDPIIQTFFDPHQVLSDTSVEGVVWRIGYRGSAGYFATMKTSKRVAGNRSYNMLHELLVGLVLNFLRPYTPNFMYVWGGFSCSSPTQGGPLPVGVATTSVTHAHNFGTLCTDNTPDNMDVLMLNENVAVFDTFEGTVRRAMRAATALAGGAAVADLVRWVDILYILFQIIISLAMAQHFCKFVHGDLHANNVLVKRLPADVTLDYRFNGARYQLQTRYIAVIIDYGFSRVTSVDTLPNGDPLPPGGPPNDTNMPPLRYAWDGARDIFTHAADRPENVHYRNFMPLYDMARLTQIFDNPVFNSDPNFNDLNVALNTGLILPHNVNVSGLFNWYLTQPRGLLKFTAFIQRGHPMEDMARNLWAELPALAANVPRGLGFI